MIILHSLIIILEWTLVRNFKKSITTNQFIVIAFLVNSCCDMWVEGHLKAQSMTCFFCNEFKFPALLFRAIYSETIVIFILVSHL